VTTRPLLLFALLATTVPPVGAQRADSVEIRELRAVPPDIVDEARRVLSAAGARLVQGDLLVHARDTIFSDLAVLGGELLVDGLVAGRVLAINGDVVVRGGGRLAGSLIVIGGGLRTPGGGVVEGDARIYTDPVRMDREGERLVVRDESEDEAWYRRWMSPRANSGSELRLVTTRTYNRVEGLPLLLGPRIKLAYSWGRVTIDAMGILRSADRFELRSENLGHQLRAEVEVGGERGFRLGGRLDDVVDPVEDWHLADSEIGIASFILHRDFRDYFSRHGSAVTAAAFMGDNIDLSIRWSDEEWGSREARDPWSLLRDNQSWRPNPGMDRGRFHLMRAEARYDTRNDRRDPWSGWFVTGAYEYGSGWISRYASTTQGIRNVNPTGRTVYDRLFLDVRRYNRVSAEAQLNVRLVVGGWLSGDDLPLQRRFSLGGAGSLPGYDFREVRPGTDRLTCAGARDQNVPGGARSPTGTPAQCERIVLGQIEYRGEIGSRFFGFLNEERRHRRYGWGRRAEWAVFANTGRGWLVGPHGGDLQYGAGTLPPVSTWHADVGIGLRLDDLGLYVAKSITEPHSPVNFFARLRPRF